MKRLILAMKVIGIAAAFSAGSFASQELVLADPSKYPQFAQQSLPENITPIFINVEELVDVVKTGGKPLIIDVRSTDEFKEGHILGAMSAPLVKVICCRISPLRSIT